MHLSRVVNWPGDESRIMDVIFRRMIDLKWDIDAEADVYVRAHAGEWYQAKAVVEVLVTDGHAYVDVSPDSSLAAGPAWQRTLEGALDEFLHSVGATPSTFVDDPALVDPADGHTTPFVGEILDRADFEPPVWARMERAVAEAAPFAADTPVEILPFFGRTPTEGAREGAGGGGGSFLGPVLQGIGEGLGHVLGDKIFHVVSHGVKDLLGLGSHGDHPHPPPHPPGGPIRPPRPLQPHGRVHVHLPDRTTHARFPSGHGTGAPRRMQPRAHAPRHR